MRQLQQLPVEGPFHPHTLRAEEYVQAPLQDALAQPAQHGRGDGLVHEEKVVHAVALHLVGHLLDDPVGPAHAHAAAVGQGVAAEGAFAPVAAPAGDDGQDRLRDNVLLEGEVAEIRVGQRVQGQLGRALVDADPPPVPVGQAGHVFPILIGPGLHEFHDAEFGLTEEDEIQPGEALEQFLGSQVGHHGPAQGDGDAKALLDGPAQGQRVEQVLLGQDGEAHQVRLLRGHLGQLRPEERVHGCIWERGPILHEGQ